MNVLNPDDSVVNVFESNYGDGQDSRFRLTMPVDAFMELAPIAALEAAAIQHSRFGLSTT